VSGAVRVSLLQLGSGADRGANLEAIEKGLRTAAERGSRLALLPEACLYRGPFSAAYVEDDAGPALSRLAELARELGLAVVVGGVWTRSPEADRAYNTCLVLDRQGRIVARYHKVHLFRLDRPDRPVDDEAAFTVPGGHLTVVRAGPVHLGLTICYDLRFPALYRALASAGATVLCVPANFSDFTGPAHWELLLRARAVENLAYVVAPAQVGGDATGFSAYGHSVVVDPWGTVVARTDEAPAVLTVDLDPDAVRRRREQLHTLDHHRADIYVRRPRRVTLDD
jgi:predicted amidohydrolase